FIQPSQPRNRESSPASNVRADVESIATKFNCHPVFADLHTQPDEVEKLIKDHTLTISLLPYANHARVLSMCLRAKRHLVTASYVTPELRELCNEAKELGLIVSMENGLDPGIDHMLAMEAIESIKEHGGTVDSFLSYCGGLPAPEHSDNPLRYKFSWSPEGALLSTLNAARYLKAGKIVEIPKGGHLMLAAQDIEFFPGFNLEGYPNRDSLHYKDLYGIQSAKNILRGTLRYAGYSNSAWGLIQLGLLSDAPHPSLHPDGPEVTWRQLLCFLVGKPQDIFVGTLKDAVFNRLGKDREKFECVDALGLFEDDVVKKRTTPLATISTLLSEKFKYKPHETDVVIMVLDISSRFPNNTAENHKISMVKYGDPNGYSAMALTVGYPTAIVTKMILEEEIQDKGLVLPLSMNIYRPVLKRLKAEGISAVVKTTDRLSCRHRCCRCSWASTDAAELNGEACGDCNSSGRLQDGCWWCTAVTADASPPSCSWWEQGCSASLLPALLSNSWMAAARPTTRITMVSPRKKFQPAVAVSLLLSLMYFPRRLAKGRPETAPVPVRSSHAAFRPPTRSATTRRRHQATSARTALSTSDEDGAEDDGDDVSSLRRSTKSAVGQPAADSAVVGVVRQAATTATVRKSGKSETDLRRSLLSEVPSGYSGHLVIVSSLLIKSDYLTLHGGGDVQSAGYKDMLEFDTSLKKPKYWLDDYLLVKSA
uniref:Saccharopine dehydrogenase n=1 Tax=Macrostomum lignano TaxID=282301 RepID=A0A1I8IE92_9PLAT